VPEPFRFDRSWRFDVPVDELWEAVADTAAYPRLWPWLADYESGPLVAGTVATFSVQPPLPYRLRFVVHVHDVVARDRVRAFVLGDVEGPARLDVASTPTGSSARLTWELELRRPVLARVEPVVRPVMILGHDLVVAMGVRQFRRRAIRASTTRRR
jgi:hypothetical protein